MLCLTRRLKEAIMINDNIEIVVLETREDRVMIGIQAPKEMKIYRKEIWLKRKSAEKDSTE